MRRRAVSRDGEEGHRLVGRDQGDLLADPGRARLPQLHRQALLHPVGIDDAGAAQGRPAGGQQISLRLVVGVALLPHLPARRGAGLGPAARARRHRHRHPAFRPRRQFGLYQARHRPARRPHRADRRRRLSERPPAAPRAPAADPAADRREFALRPRRARQRPGARPRRPALLPARHRPRISPQRPPLRHDRHGLFAGRRLRAGHGAAGPCLPDGRQSRP